MMFMKVLVLMLIKEIVDGINVTLRGHSPHTACMIIAMNYFCMVMDFPHTHWN